MSNAHSTSLSGGGEVAAVGQAPQRPGDLVDLVGTGAGHPEQVRPWRPRLGRPRGEPGDLGHEPVGDRVARAPAG